jgi:hypothetical protein
MLRGNRVLPAYVLFPNLHSLRLGKCTPFCFVIGQVSDSIVNFWIQPNIQPTANEEGMHFSPCAEDNCVPVFVWTAWVIDIIHQRSNIALKCAQRLHSSCTQPRGEPLDSLNSYRCELERQATHKLLHQCSNFSCPRNFEEDFAVISHLLFDYILS